MTNDKPTRTFLGDCGLLLALALYVCALTVWTPLYLMLPWPIPGFTYRQTLAIRWDLVRLIWRHTLRRHR